MSGYGPPRGWRGSNAWGAAPSQPSDTAAGGPAVGGDYVKRLRAQLDGRERVHHALGESHPSMLLVDEPDLREALDELVQLRAERVQDTRAVIDIVRSIERGLLGNISPADELRNHFGNRDARLAPQPTKREGGD